MADIGEVLGWRSETEPYTLYGASASSLSTGAHHPVEPIPPTLNR